MLEKWVLPENAVLVHIGPPKTGTTYLQHVLAERRAELLERGILYPGTGPRQVVASWSLRGAAMPGHETPPPRVWKQVAGQVRRHGGRAVLSSEAFATLKPEKVAQLVEDLGRDRVHPVFLLDEAHLLHQDMLDHLHILLNYQWDSRALLSLVLVGLPELEDRLTLRRNRSLYSRLHRRLTIDPLSSEDTGEYLRMRLAKVGCERDLFTSEAVAMIHEAALGSLRETDRVATGALREAARRKRKLVERDAVSKVVAANRDD